MTTRSFSQVADEEQYDAARACSAYHFCLNDFLIKREGDDVLVWYHPSGKRRRYQAGTGWIALFRADLVEQYFRSTDLGVMAAGH
jgi:hypothetical protein